MVDDKPKPRTAEPASLLSQWWTMGRIAADRRTTGRHMKAGWVIINSYWQKHGNGRASLSYIQQATGLDRKAAVKACRELDEWGHATRVPGIGTRPSEYVPHWVTSASGVQMTTTSDDAPSGVQMTTTLVVESTPLDDASGVQMTPQTYLRTPAYRPAVQEVESSSAAPATPPHAAGPVGAASGEAPQVGFEEFWNSYAHKQKRDKAEAAWAKLDPSPDLAAIIITEASRWAAHYVEHNVDKKWRAMPHNWLASKSWTCDLPIIYTDPKSAAISKVRGSAKATATNKPTSLNIRRYRITDYQTEGSPFADWYEIFTFEGEDGTMPFTQRMHVLKSGTENADDAPDYYAKHQLCRAAFGKGNPEGDYIGRVIGMNSDKSGIMFHHLPDVIQPEPAPPPARIQRALTPEEAQADYDAWFEASLEEEQAALAVDQLAPRDATPAYPKSAAEPILNTGWALAR
jgi:hypothetical protein